MLCQAPVSPAALRKLHKRLAKYAEELCGKEEGREGEREGEREGGGEDKGRDTTCTTDYNILYQELKVLQLLVEVAMFLEGIPCSKVELARVTFHALETTYHMYMHPL